MVYLHNQQGSGSDGWQSDLNSLITFLVRYGAHMHGSPALLSCITSAILLTVPGCSQLLLMPHADSKREKITHGEEAVQLRLGVTYGNGCKETVGVGNACRVANLGSNSSISSGQVAFQYWFNGPMDLPDAADPLSQLTTDCLDATTGMSVILVVFSCARHCHITSMLVGHLISLCSDSSVRRQQV